MFYSEAGYFVSYNRQLDQNDIFRIINYDLDKVYLIDAYRHLSESINQL